MSSLQAQPGDRRASGSTRTVVFLPGAPPMVAWSFVGRFAVGMMNLSLLLFIRAETGSYAVAGAMSAAGLVGTAAGTLVQGRLIDRYGPSRWPPRSWRSPPCCRAWRWRHAPCGRT